MVDKQKAVDFMTELRELLDKYSIEISMSTADQGPEYFDQIEFSHMTFTPGRHWPVVSHQRICRFSNPPVVDAGEIGKLLDKDPLPSGEWSI